MNKNIKDAYTRNLENLKTLELTQINLDILRYSKSWNIQSPGLVTQCNKIYLFIN